MEKPFDKLKTKEIQKNDEMLKSLNNRRVKYIQKNY